MSDSSTRPAVSMRLQATVEGAGAELQRVVGLARDVLHDAIPVTLLFGEREKYVENGRRERK